MIRQAQLSDIAQILQIYEAARAFMRSCGNPNQWGTGNPTEQTLRRDISQGNLFVVEDSQIQGVFALLAGPDPTYGYIEGSWHTDQPYGVIHRIASRGQGRGILKQCLEFAFCEFHYLRIDTHADNAPMHHLLRKHGFLKCGTIYLANGDPRIAYDRLKA